MLKLNDEETTIKIVDGESFEMVDDNYGIIEFEVEKEKYLNYRLTEVTGSSVLVYQSSLVNLLQ